MTDVLKRVKARSMECGDCWIWLGNKSAGGVPKFSEGSARRRVYEAAKGHLKQTELVTTSCGQVDCLNPDHLVKTNQSKVTAKVKASQTMKAKVSASMAKEAQSRCGKITMEIARQIRSDNRDGVVWAKELSVSTSLVSLVRTNKAWREVSNPFAGLMR